MKISTSRITIWILAVGFALSFSSDALALDAATLYMDHCARCHGEKGDGRGETFSMQRPWPRDFIKGEYKFRSTPLGTLPTLEDVIKVTRDGILRTSMPPYKKFLTEEEIRAVSEYVLNISKQSGLPDGAPDAIAPPLDLDKVEITPQIINEGKKLFTKYECNSCHGDDGKGLGSLTGGLYDTNGYWIMPSDLTDPMSYGGGSNASDVYVCLKTDIALSPMLQYADVLSEEEARAISLYVKSLQLDVSERKMISQDKWKETLPPKVRGEYMYRAMTCSLCHNSYDWRGAYYPDLPQAGGVIVRLPGLGTFPSSNLTSHPDGMLDRTEEDIVSVITTGHAKDRRIEAFAMPWVYYHHLTPEDAKDIAVYVKSLPPIANKVPERTWDPFHMRIWYRFRQMTNMETGRLEYPRYNSGDAISEEVEMFPENHKDYKKQ